MNDHNLEIALACAARGWKVFPCRWDAKSKRHRPLNKWATESTCDPEKIKALHGDNVYWCCALGQSGFAVIDVDCKGRHNGNVTLADLHAQALELPPTLVVSTPSNGLHYWYRGKGLKSTAAALGPGVDTRGEGGMVPLPGQIAHGKGEYAVYNDAAIAELPRWVLDRAPAGTRSKDTRPPEGELDTEASVAAARQYLDTAETSTEGDGGNNQAYRVIARVRDLGVSEVKALDLLDNWNRRCDPPWGSDELATLVRNAYTYASGRQGAASPSYPAVVPEGDEKCNSDPFAPEVQPPCPVVPLAHFWTREAPRREWLIEDWIPAQGNTLLTGNGGTGKSTLAIQLAYSAASGRDWLGLKVCRTMPALLVFCEDSEDEIHRRALETRMAPEYKPMDGSESVTFWPRLGRQNTLGQCREGQVPVRGPFWRELDAQLSAMPRGRKIVVLDTASDIFAGNENDRSGVSQFVKTVLGELSARHDALFVVSAHPPKSETEGTEYSGSTAWHGAFRARLYLRHYDPKAPDDKRVLTCSKQNYGRSGHSMILARMDPGYFQRMPEAEVQLQIDEWVYVQVVEYSAKGRPLNLGKSSPNYIKSAGVKDRNGKPVDLGILRESLLRLEEAGRIHVAGGTHGGNGYQPSGDF